MEIIPDAENSDSDAGSEVSGSEVSGSEVSGSEVSDPILRLEDIYMENADVSDIQYTNCLAPEPSGSVAEEQPLGVVEESPAVAEPVPKQVYQVPKVIFIVPYRNREKEKVIFEKQMSYIMEDYDASYYKIWYIHQMDTRTFNRGAMKNIGFIYARYYYPNDYRSISFVFNDVDTMPRNKNALLYETTEGTIKHYYGFDYALGGIASINGADFEKMNGFPNFWAWGFEDNLIQKRANMHGITIDRSTFFVFTNFNQDDPNIIHLNLEGGLFRDTNRGEFDRFISNTREGIDSIRNIRHHSSEYNGLTNGMPVDMINIEWFDTGINENPLQKSEVHLSTAQKPYGKILTVSNRKQKPVMHMRF